MQNTVQLGTDQNISVEKIEGSYVVTLPNSYDVYWEFTQKSNNFGTFTKDKASDPKKIIFSVPEEAINTDKAVSEFNSKVNQAKNFIKEIMKEKEDLEYIITFDKKQPGNDVTFLYKNPANGFMVGEVIKSGKYFVALAAGESADKTYVRVVHTNRLLNGKEDFANREQAIADRFPVGAVKYLKFDNFGKVVAKDYEPSAKKKPAKIKQ